MTPPPTRPTRPTRATAAIAAIAAALTLTTAAAQLEPPTCQGRNPQHDCRIATWELDPLGAAADADLDAIATAERLLEMGDAPEARAHLMNALTATSGEARARMYFLLGHAEALLGDHIAAARAFAAVKPATFASRYNTAIAYAAAGDTQLAGTLLDDLLTAALEARVGVDDLSNIDDDHPLTPETTDAARLILTAIAALHYQTGQPAAAFTAIGELLTVTGETPELARMRATAAIEALPEDGVVTYALTAAEGDDRDLLLGRAYAKAGMHEYARRHYQAAAAHATSVEDAEALAEIAAYRAQRGDWAAAAEAANAALRIDPANHTARTVTALELERRGEHADAAREHQLAARLGGDPATAQARAALNLEAAGDHASAVTAAEAALEAAEGSEDDATTHAMHALLARAHHRLGDQQRALEHANAAAASQHATTADHAYAADLALAANDPETALAHYQEADWNDPRVARGAYQANMLLERYEEARAAAEHLTGDAGEALYLIAWTYALQGDTASAYQAWSRAADADHQPAREIIARTK